MRRRPIRILELRSVWGKGGGPDKTILLGTERADPERYAIKVCYLRDLRDDSFEIAERAKGRVDYIEVLERHSFDPRIWTQLRRLVREGNFDILHAHDYKTDLLAWLLARVENVIPLATAHNWAGDSWKEQLYYAADRRLLTRFPCVIAVSRPVRDALLHAGAVDHRVRLVLNAIDPQRFRRDSDRQEAARARFGLGPGTRGIGTVGRIESEKRLDLLLDAFAAVHRDRPEIRLLVAGTGSRLDEMRSRARGLGVDQAVRFLGHVDDVITLHHALDLYVQASIREGTPNAVLEAMSLETPIVATDVGGTSDLVRDREHAILVPSGDAAALAAGIRAALHDTPATQRRRAAARARVEQEFSFGARMAAVESIYEELVDIFGSSTEGDRMSA